MSTHLIGLSSFNLFEEPKYIEVDEDEMYYGTIFNIDRCIREVVIQQPGAQWTHIAQGLSHAGYKTTDQVVAQNIFWHARHWDEHMDGSQMSFFVTFPPNSPSELNGEIFMATTYASLFALVSDADCTSGNLLLINAQHKVIYPEDKVWADDTQTSRATVGPVIIIQDQFATPEQAGVARQRLQASGYEIYRGAAAAQ